MSALRAFLYAPSPATHKRDLGQINSLLPRLSASELIDSAYRRSSARQNAFVFAQGVVVGALGNLFASAAGHFIDRGNAAFQTADAVWTGVAVVSLGAMVSMGLGALRRYRYNSEVETVFLGELKRRGARIEDDTEDPDDLLALPGRGGRDKAAR